MWNLAIDKIRKTIEIRIKHGKFTVAQTHTRFAKACSYSEINQRYQYNLFRELCFISRLISL